MSALIWQYTLCSNVGRTTSHTSSKTPPNSIATLAAVVMREQLERGDGLQPDCFTCDHVTLTLSLLVSSPADLLVLPPYNNTFHNTCHDLYNDQIELKCIYVGSYYVLVQHHNFYYKTA